MPAHSGSNHSFICVLVQIWRTSTPPCPFSPSFPYTHSFHVRSGLFFFFLFTLVFPASLSQPCLVSLASFSRPAFSRTLVSPDSTFLVGLFRPLLPEKWVELLLRFPAPLVLG